MRIFSPVSLCWEISDVIGGELIDYPTYFRLRNYIEVLNQRDEFVLESLIKFLIL
jgi:hypothetical protein